MKYLLFHQVHTHTNSCTHNITMCRIEKWIETLAHSDGNYCLMRFSFNSDSLFQSCFHVILDQKWTKRKWREMVHLLLAVSYFGTALQLLMRIATIPINPPSLKMFNWKSMFVTSFETNLFTFYWLLWKIWNFFLYYHRDDSMLVACTMNSKRMIWISNVHSDFIRKSCHRQQNLNKRNANCSNRIFHQFCWSVPHSISVRFCSSLARSHRQ